ncbi:hypothetical protein EUTSA_v10009196mg [Eutrema salsugineum]|uniref:Uncharacterized protein n=1 Tax=Eutrema salsugineum TaxID=72664 RepID=V4KRS6_EUTSA|nr:hypothetical protein EUTSA_v10009196mg [Eutrema salsugineum]
MTLRTTDSVPVNQELGYLLIYIYVDAEANEEIIGGVSVFHDLENSWLVLVLGKHDPQSWIWWRTQTHLQTLIFHYRTCAEYIYLF